jgi:cytidylate kinase
LRAAHDAIVVNTDGLNEEQVLTKLIGIVQSKVQQVAR